MKIKGQKDDKKADEAQNAIPCSNPDCRHRTDEHYPPPHVLLPTEPAVIFFIRSLYEWKGENKKMKTISTEVKPPNDDELFHSTMISQENSMDDSGRNFIVGFQPCLLAKIDTK